MKSNSLEHKKVFIQTWGWQMNEYDSKLVRLMLKFLNISHASLP